MQNGNINRQPTKVQLEDPHLKKFQEAVALHRQGDLISAKELYREVLKDNANYLDALHMIGLIAYQENQLNDAIEILERTLISAPYFCPIYLNYGLTLYSINKIEDAIEIYKKALLINPFYAEVYHNLGLALTDLNRFEEAIVHYESAFKLKKNELNSLNNILFLMSYLPHFSFEIRMEKARQYGIQIANLSENKFDHSKIEKHTKKIKIGFVSGDFREHPVAYFLESLISSIDQSKFEIVAYTNNPSEDDVTLGLKAKFSSFERIYHLSDLDAAQLIHSNQINILIDLSGHTSMNRLSMFALKPAPLQLSWLGYWATTGVQEIDYFLGDPYVTPIAEEHHFFEKIKRLPETYFCFTPPKIDVEVCPLPALANHHITFGCFNNLRKVNDEVMAVWAKILLSISGSCLLLKSKQLSDPIRVCRVIESFKSLGVSPERLYFEGLATRIDYLKSYNRIDIALDPFPYPGGTTSVEALWMGVPVLTKKGRSFIAHNGETIAHNSWQADWIAHDDNDYIAKAINFSSDLQALAKLRSGLRAQVLASPLFDSERFARNFEKAMLEIWEDYTTIS